MEFLKFAVLFNRAPRGSEVSAWKPAEHLPTVEFMEVAGIAPTDYDRVFSREPANRWWDQFSCLQKGEKIDTPAYSANTQTFSLRVQYTICREFTPKPS